MPEIINEPLDPALDIADMITPEEAGPGSPQWRFHRLWVRAGMPSNATNRQGNDAASGD